MPTVNETIKPCAWCGSRAEQTGDTVSCLNDGCQLSHAALPPVAWNTFSDTMELARAVSGLSVWLAFNKDRSLEIVRNRDGTGFFAKATEAYTNSYGNKGTSSHCSGAELPKDAIIDLAKWVRNDS